MAREVSVPLALRHAIAAYMPYRAKFEIGPEYPLLCSSRRAKRGNADSWRLSNKTIWEIAHRLLLAAGVPKQLAKAHTLRHAHARKILSSVTKATGDVSEALLVTMRQLGHSNINTTMIYVQESDEKRSELLEKIA